jgi:hypothetical protein
MPEKNESEKKMTETTTGITVAKKETQVPNLPPAVHEWSMMQRQCKAFVMSGYLPEHITRGARTIDEALARAVTIAQKGKELGLPPMQSFSSITVIKGKPCLAAELMLALCYQRAKGFKATFTTPPDKQNQECTVVMQRFGGDPQTFRFTIQDAQKAGLVKTGSGWDKFPASMLRARAISAGCRAVAPDATMGCYTPEELGGAPIDMPLEPELTGTLPDSKPEVDPQQASGSADDLATEAQIKRLYAVGKENGLSHEGLKDGCKALFGKDHLNELTKAEVQEFFKEIEGLPKDEPAPERMNP